VKMDKFLCLVYCTKLSVRQDKSAIHLAACAQRDLPTIHKEFLKIIKITSTRYKHCNNS